MDASASFVVAAGADIKQSALAPHGIVAQEIFDLWTLLAAVAVGAYVVVLALTAVALFRPRRTAADERTGTRWIVIGGLGVPAMAVGVLFVMSLRTLGALAVPPAEPAIAIDVMGHQWWWSISYEGPDDGFVTANEIHVPVGAPVRVRLRSADVIHSFWVPSLAGKLDLIPGKTTETWIQADRVGVYRGQCAEYCGLQHARMALLVVAQPPEEFEAWRQAQRRPAATPTDAVAVRGMELFARNCAGCHAVRGAPFAGRAGPDLTHLASRRTLASGMLANVRGALAGWIANPQVLKPGTRMPHITLAAEELHALVRYLEELR
jgi:cytochrome c oxidase subunit 2